MDNRIYGAIIVLAVFLLAVLGMVVSWRRRKRRQGSLASALLPVPADTGSLIAVAPGLYLATTPAENRIDRVAVGGLGFRARLDVHVTSAGIVLPVPGGSDVFIPASAIASVGTASWTIDRGIEPGGLTVVAWSLGDARVESYFRFDEPARVIAAVDSIITATAGSSTK